MPNPIQAKQIATGVNPTQIDVGDAAAEGTSESVARADHVHALPAPAAPADVDKSAASAGVSTNVARQDHKHDVSTASAVAVGAANAEGVATSLARSDHTHQVTDLAITSQVQGSTLYFNGTNWVQLSPGTSGEFLQTQGAGANPVWAAAPTGAVDWKDSVLVISTSNITLSGEQTIDGITTSTSRVLVAGQSTASENGIYVTAAGAWTRATDFDGTGGNVTDGATTWVEQGTVYADTHWTLITNDPITVGTTALTFENTSTPIGAAQGDVIFFDANGRWQRLAAGTAGQFLQTQGGAADPVWASQAGGIPRQEEITTENIINTDTALGDTLNFTPISDASVVLYLNGVQQIQGATRDYSISGTTITWLAAQEAVNLSTSDTIIVTYDS